MFFFSSIKKIDSFLVNYFEEGGEKKERGDKEGGGRSSREREISLGLVSCHITYR